MAITITATPDAINPAYRPIKFTTSSTSTSTIRGIRADLYIDGVYTSTVDGVQKLGASTIFDFDIRKIMQSDLVHELRTNITIFQITDATISAKAIKMRFFEIVISGGVFTTTWSADGAGTGYVESSNYNVVNMAQQHQDVSSEWTVDDATKKLLTLSEDNRRIPRGVPFQVGFIGSDTNYVCSAVQRDVNLVSLGASTTAILASLSNSKGVIEIPSSLTSASNVAYLDITLQKHLTGNRSILYRYKVNDPCNEFVLFWQNHLGDFDHFNFGTKVTLNVNTKNQNMEQALEDGFSSEDSGKLTIESVATSKIRVQTGSLSQVEINLIKGVIKNHTVVYKWDSAGVFLRYIVKSHSTKIEDNDGLINSLSLTLEPSNDHVTQKGS